MARELQNHGARSNGSDGGCESRSARLFQCARCHALTKICSHCDRGNVYCGDCAISACIAQTVLRHRTAFLKRYGHRLSDEHRHTLSAITRCRTEYYGQLSWHCRDCQETRNLYRSCGHRSCLCCQNSDNTLWLERQRRKLLPVNYFMLTFTVPAELRGTFWKNQKLLYELLLTSSPP